MTTTSTPRVGCRSCGSDLTSDPRFVQWCPSCGWNANPGGNQAKGRTDRLLRKLNSQAEERLYRKVTADPSTHQALSAAKIGAFAMAGLVHLVTLALAVGGVWLLFYPSWVARGLGVLALLVAVHQRPRLGPSRKARKSMLTLDPAAAPRLYALTERVAAELGTAAPSVIVVDGSYNASYRRTGVRRRVMLSLGLPLWEVLTPGQRLALLGHELGHGANGDSRQGLWVGTALAALREWYYLFRPGRRMVVPGSVRASAQSGIASLGEMVARALLAVFAELTLLAHRVLTRLTLLSGRRAEYLADALSARVAGPDRTAELLQALTMGSVVEHVRQKRRLTTASLPRSRRDSRGPDRRESKDLWTELREHLASVPPSERARRLLVSQLDDSAVDSTHPPTHLRLTYVQQLPPSEPTIAIGADEVAAIENELAAARTAIAHALS